MRLAGTLKENSFSLSRFLFEWSKRGTKNVLLFIGFVTACAILINILDYWVFYPCPMPPSSVRTIDGFRKWKTILKPIFKANIQGATYYMIYGSATRSLNSGPSAFVFDKHGNLVVWSQDFGDFRNGILTAFYDKRYPEIQESQFLSELSNNRESEEIGMPK